MLNIATRGTSAPDFPSQIPGARDHDPDPERWACGHEVEILPGARPGEVVGTDKVAVNSFQHRPVKDQPLFEGLGRGAR